MEGKGNKKRRGRGRREASSTYPHLRTCFRMGSHGCVDMYSIAHVGHVRLHFTCPGKTSFATKNRERVRVAFFGSKGSRREQPMA